MQSVIPSNNCAVKPARTAKPNYKKSYIFAFIKKINK